jgi:hypothetical protein
MTMQPHTFQTLVSETHSLHAQANGKIQLVIEVEPGDRKTALAAFSKPGAALAVVRLPSVFDRSQPAGYSSDSDEDDDISSIMFH